MRDFTSAGFKDSQFYFEEREQGGADLTFPMRLLTENMKARVKKMGATL